MRTLFTLAVGFILLLAMTASAEVPQNPQTVSNAVQNYLVDGGHSGHAVLQLSPIYLEIQQILDTTKATEERLLEELAEATEEDDAARIIRRIERLEVDRDLSILKIQARYARLDGRWDLEYQLRARILEVLESEVYAVK